jgi:lipopolysaccharide export system protein LptA
LKRAAAALLRLTVPALSTMGPVPVGVTTAAVMTSAVVTPAWAQQLDFTHGGPIDITARDGLEWRQNDRQVIARGDARAIRGGVTVTADRLTAWYRKKGATEVAQTTPASGLAGDPSTEGNEIYRLQADGHVHIFTATDQAQGDKATYDLDQGVLVMTGHDLKLTTPNDVITARDDLEYWPQQHMAVARGNAVVVTTDAKRVAADTLVAYTTDNPPPASAQPPGSTQSPASAQRPGSTTAAAAPKSSASTQAPASTQASATPGGSKSGDDPLAASGKLQRVEAFGNVSVRTPTDTVTGDRGVYVPDTGMARLGGNVRITRGQNQLNGAEADVNMKTGIATLISQRPGTAKVGAPGRVHGLVVPNDASNKSLGADPAAAAGTAAKKPGAGQPTPGQTTPGQTTPGQTTPGQTTPGQTTPGQTTPGKTAPGQSTPGQSPSAQSGATPSGATPSGTASSGSAQSVSRP